MMQPNQGRLNRSIGKLYGLIPEEIRYGLALTGHSIVNF